MLAWLLLQVTAVSSATCRKAEYVTYGDKNKFHLHGLPYDYASLDPFLWEPEVFYHYNKTHQGLVDQLNNVVGWNSQYSGLTLEELLLYKANNDTKLAQSAGGHYSHSLWWWVLAPTNCARSEPSGALADKLVGQWGSFSNFQAEFEKYAKGIFGSGWAWLCLDSSQVLQLKAKREEFSPLQEGCLPLFGIDVWEHAYYLTYLQNRGSYAAAMWSYVDWDLLEYFYDEFLVNGNPVPI
jgi:Fe-Mn family superoxide dismutase